MMNKKNILLLVGACVVVASISVGTVFLLLRQPNANYKFDKVARENIVETVNTSGQVKSAEAVDLSLPLSGRVAAVNAKVGDTVKAGQIILQLENGDYAAQVAQAKAVLDKQLAGYTTDYIAQLQAALDKANNDLMQAEGAVPGAEGSKLVDNAYDDLFANLQSIQVSLSSALTAADNILGIDNSMANDAFQDYLSILNSNKLIIAKTKYQVAKISKDNFDSNFNQMNDASDHEKMKNTVTLAKNVLNDTKNLLFSITEVLDNTPPVGTLTQTTLDGLKTGIQTIRNTIASKYTTLMTQEHAVQVAVDNYNSLKLVAERAAAALSDAKNPPREVDTAANRATLSLAQANYAKTVMRSPIDGVITKQDAKVGSMISPSIALVSVINAEQYQVDVYLSEANIAKVQAGNKAIITFDSYGTAQQFQATLIKIDPAGITQSNGIISYKATLQFDNRDERIKVGLTANVKIITQAKENVLVLPDRDLVQKDGQYYALVKTGGESDLREVIVATGIKSEQGKREIVSGLNEGEQVVSYSSVK